ncbi:MAG: hypothetical protein GF353_23615 [Candidatus Lokiarchaeota archaeon]|nr:hypothetical protein [Candidatus Lokiarchaeota archaeon]
MSIQYDYLLNELNRTPFSVIIAKYDQILGPRILFSSCDFKDPNFVKSLLRDSLNTKNKYVQLNFTGFYGQIDKVEIEDNTARGGKQLYAIILLRHKDYPPIPVIHFKRIEQIFHKIGKKRILSDHNDSFMNFYKEVHEIYLEKQELLPLESINLQIRSGINTIHGFCQLILEENRNKKRISKENLIPYIKMMLDSCNDVIDAVEKSDNLPI